MTIEKLKPIFSLEQDLVEKLKQLIPEAVADGKINWDVLKEALGEHLEEEGEVEHFGLNWAGKRQARRLASLPSKGTLKPVIGEGIDEENTGNIFIEGDNLEVLKLLQKSYAGRIKMIYIDPPYNTGNDLIYKDNFSEVLEDYLRKTGQVDEEGNLLTSNPKSGGRFHSNWLNMMYPRLKLAKNLLRDDGLIFISINDNELHNLRFILSEVFGEENFIGIFVWQSKKGGGSDSGSVVIDQEYIICFSKVNNKSSLSKIALLAEELDLIDEKSPYRRGRELNKWGSNSRREDRPTMFFPIPGPNGEDVFPIRNDGSEGRWRLGKEKMLDLVERNDAEFVKRADGTYIVYEKIRSTSPREKPFRTLLKEVGTTADGSKTLKDLFNGKKLFDFPKPVDLIETLISMGTLEEEEHIVLDFFAGSSTTAHAVLEANRKDNGNRKFIMIQVPEICNKNSEAYQTGYKTISEISRVRIIRVGEKIKEQLRSQLQFEEQKLDLGFNFFKLTKSNLKIWEEYKFDDVQVIQTSFLNFENPLIDGWKEEDVVTEIQLLEGFPLDSKIEQASEFTKNHVLRVSSEYIGHKLFICLEDKLKAETIEQVNSLSFEDKFICLDNALTDEAKLQLADGCNIKTI